MLIPNNQLMLLKSNYLDLQKVMELKKSLIVAVILGLLSVTAWELYWRSQGLMPNIDDNKNLWANQRARLENPTDKTVGFIGSSRILYEYNLDI